MTTTADCGLEAAAAVRSTPGSYQPSLQCSLPGVVAVGGCNRDIASDLVISIKTIDCRRVNMLQKLGRRDRLALSRYAIRAGLIEP